MDLEQMEVEVAQDKILNPQQAIEVGVQVLVVTTTQEEVKVMKVLGEVVAAVTLLLEAVVVEAAMCLYLEGMVETQVVKTLVVEMEVINLQLEEMEVETHLEALV